MKKEIDPARLEQLAGSGKTTAEICEELGISNPTFYLRLKTDPELKAAYERGRAAAKAAKQNGTDTLSPTDLDVLDGIEAFGKDGATFQRLRTIESVSHLPDSQISTSIKKLTEAGRVHALPVGTSQTQTYFAGKGEKKSMNKTRQENNGARKTATKRTTKSTSSTKRSTRVLKHSKTEEDAAPPAINHNDGEQVKRALMAARAEFYYQKCWGIPSPMFEETFNLLTQAQSS
jgi:hypothetical protein